MRVCVCVRLCLCVVCVNLSDLFLHSLDLVLPWLHLSPQLLDLVVKNKLEFLQFLVFLLQVINSLLL